VAAGELADGALDAGPYGVALMPGGVLLVGAVAGLQLVELARGKPTVRLPSPEVVQAALAGQGWHWALVKRATMSGAASGRGRGVGAVPPLADLALGAGDFPAVVVGAEVVAGVALLDAVLAGAVAGQRPGEGDPVLAPGPLHVHQGGVAAVHQVLVGEQAPTLQPGVDPGQGMSVVAGGGHGGDVGDDVGPVFGAGLGHVGEVSRPAGDLAP